MWTKIKYHLCTVLVVFGIFVIISELILLVHGEHIEASSFWHYRVFNIGLMLYLVGDYLKWKREYKREITGKEIIKMFKENHNIIIDDIQFEVEEKVKMIIISDDERLENFGVDEDKEKDND